MFSQSDLDQLLAAMRANGVTRLDLRARGKRLRLDLPAGTVPSGPSTPQASAPPSIPAQSPGIGRFLPRGGGDGLPDLAPDTTVVRGEVLGYVCQGDARAIVQAPESGRLRGKAPATDEVLGFGDTVFTVEPDS